MRYLLIVGGLLAGGLGFYVMGAPNAHAGFGLLFGLIAGLALVAGLATCDIVAAIRERHSPQ
jgi:hypothetical protein